MFDFSPAGITNMLLSLPIILFSLTIHEYAHGYVANLLGDHTARNLGRLTLNPLKHIDPLGFLCMIFARVGWAKAVPVNSRNFRKPRRDMALTAIAGPVVNLIAGFLFLILTHVALTVFYGNEEWIMQLDDPFSIPSLIYSFLYSGAILNVYLAVFNMIPIPPFDGSRFFYIFLPTKWYFGVMKYERIIMIVMLVLLWTGVFSFPLSIVAGIVLSGMEFLIGLIPFLI